MRTFLFTLLLCITTAVAHGQNSIVDNLKQTLFRTDNDTLRLVLYKGIADAYHEVNFDSALIYARHYLLAAQQLSYRLNEADALLQIAINQSIMGSSGNAIALLFKVQQMLEEKHDSDMLLPSRYLTMLAIAPNLQSTSKYQIYLNGKLHEYFCVVYWNNANDEKKTRTHLSKFIKIAKTLQAKDLLSTSYLFLSILNLELPNSLKNPDSALYYINKGLQHDLQKSYIKNLGEIYNVLSKAYYEKGNHANVLLYKRMALRHHLQQGNLIHTGWGYLGMAEFYKEIKTIDSTLFYAHKALQVALQTSSPPMEYYCSALLKDTYKALNKPDSAFGYMERMVGAKDKYASEQNSRLFQNAELNHQLMQQTIEAERVQNRDKMWMYGLLAGLFVFVLVAVLLWRNNQNRKKAYALLEQQKSKTELALKELKAMQAQLLQNEKMASLGELTAGIAHEIQNPLNFVNNFSEVNKELVSELRAEITKGNAVEVNEILNDIEENEQKIIQHGKRADSIVKSMLQHSRATSGEKQLTDINALAEEYLRLSYQGLRAKNKDFNANLITTLDPTIGKVEVVPQDLGRVLLNLYNNAFYATRLKKAQLNGQYQPKVKVSTHQKNGHVEIKVHDNGTGISESLKNKIFQPFFTTKPPGQGTGLGLSLCYDIVKAHGGEIIAESKEGAESEFTIKLPLPF